MTVRAFARWLGVSHTAVQGRIAAGALPTSAQRVRGRWAILDAKRAKAEWEAHTRPRMDSRKQLKSGQPSALAAATLRERVARAEAFELETARKKRLLVPAAGVEQLVTSMVVEARTALLGLPTRARQLMPHLTTVDMSTLDRLVREILEEMADGANRGGQRTG